MRRPAARLVYLTRDIGGLAVDHAQLAPLLHVAHHDERPVLRISGRGRANGGVQDAGDDLLGTGSGLSRRSARAEYMASNNPISGIASLTRPMRSAAQRSQLLTRLSLTRPDQSSLLVPSHSENSMTVPSGSRI